MTRGRRLMILAACMLPAACGLIAGVTDVPIGVDGGAAVAGCLLFALTGPVGLVLAPVPALCLLTASGWLCYLIIRGEPANAERPRMPFAGKIVAVAPADAGR